MSTIPFKSVKEKHETLLVADPKTRTAKPPLYKVLLLNDEYTPMDFVVAVLKQVFHKSHEDAIRLMLEVHHQGSATCGVFTRDVAETKADLVGTLARKSEHPLRCVIEKE